MQKRESPQPGTGRKALKPENWLLAILFVVLGFMLAFQLNSMEHWQLAGSQEEDAREATREKLLAELQELRHKNAELESELGKMQQQITKVEQEMAQGEEQLNQLYKHLEEARMLAAMVPVTGPGVVIQVNDSPLASELGENYLVHVEDLRAIVNELFLAGAEAIAINRQRIGPVSSLRCIGPVIYVNGLEMPPPYLIEAIGNPDKLEAHMRQESGILQELRNWSLEVSLKKSNHLQLPETQNPPRFTANAPSTESPGSGFPPGRLHMDAKDRYGLW